jgi:hypothetical protein
VAGNNWISVGIATGYCLFFFPLLMVMEGRHLKKTFGDDYVKWAREVSVFLPGFRKVKNPSFNISLYMKNREYRVFYLTLLATAILVLKVLKIIHTK